MLALVGLMTTDSSRFKYLNLFTFIVVYCLIKI